MRGKKKLSKKVLDVILTIAGTFVLAMSVEFFVLPYRILSGGVAGIAVALKPFLHIDETVFANAATIVLFIVGRIFLGRAFALDTLLSSICYPVFTTLLAKIYPFIPITINPTLASFYAGLLGGIGIGIVMRGGASTGGMDIPPLILHKLTGIKISTGVVITDTLTVLLGVAAYGINAALIGFVSVFASGFAIDKVLSAGEGAQAKSVTIISDHWEEIIHAIDQELARGVTILHGQGGYNGDEKMVILCVVSSRQYNHLLDLIREIDEHAFTITTDASDMHGEGFTYASPNI